MITQGFFISPALRSSLRILKAGNKKGDYGPFSQPSSYP